MHIVIVMVKVKTAVLYHVQAFILNPKQLHHFTSKIASIHTLPHVQNHKIALSNNFLAWRL